MNFCPVCGKKTKKTFCDEHREVEVEHKDIIIRVCPCQKYFYRNRWVDFKDISEPIKRISKDSIKDRIKIVEILDGEVVVNKQGETFHIPYKIQNDKCPTCSRKGTEYFVSTLQIRPKDPELLEFVEKQVEKSDDFISKIIEVKNGWNILLSSNKIALEIGKRLSKSYKGELKTSKKLQTRDKQRSKDLYRSTVFFERD